jgi:hypothetical protein
MAIPAANSRSTPMAGFFLRVIPALVEGVRQLLWRAEPERQLDGCQRCLIGGSGGSYMDAQVLMLEAVNYGVA